MTDPVAPALYAAGFGLPPMAPKLGSRGRMPALPLQARRSARRAEPWEH